MIDVYVKEGDAHADRLKGMRDFQELVRGGVYGIVDSWGEPWKEQRRFALRVLRDFGLGKELMEQEVLDEVLATVSEISQESTSAGDVDVMGHIEKSVGSVINSVLFGYSFHENGRLDEYRFVRRTLADFSTAASDPLILTAMQHPKLLRHIPPFKHAFDKLLSTRTKLFDHFTKLIEEHRRRKGLHPQLPPSDYVDTFLLEKSRLDSEGIQHHFSLCQLKNTCMDLWLGGQETTSTTIAWGITYLILNSNVQAKIHAELDSVIASDRPIRLVDRPRLPYTSAVVNVSGYPEIQRLANIFPINLFRETTRDTAVGGYRIPRGTCTLPQFSEVLYDDKVFPDAFAFRPERFIDDEGKLKKVNEFIPFSIGKRQCPGEGLARTELFLFLANILNAFKLTAGNRPPSMKRTYGIFASCGPFTCRVGKR